MDDLTQTSQRGCQEFKDMPESRPPSDCYLSLEQHMGCCTLRITDWGQSDSLTNTLLNTPNSDGHVYPHSPTDLTLGIAIIFLMDHI